MKIIIVVFFLLCNGLSAQVTQEWVASYNGTGSGFNSPRKSAIDKFGNLIIAGNSDSVAYDFIVLKYNPSGNLLWKQRYNGIGDNADYVNDMVLDDSGNVYVCGDAWEGSTTGKYNWVTIKYNTNGELNWLRKLNWTANENDECFGMTIDKDRNLYITGFGKTNSIYRQMITVKYSSNGDSLWTQVYHPIFNTYDWGYSVTTDDSNNVYASGYGLIPTGNEIVIIKYSKEGDEKWVRTFPTYYGDYLRPVFSAIGNDNNLVVVGYSHMSNYDFVTLKYSPDGDLLWDRLYSGGNIDRANSMILDSNSNILIAGFSFTTTYGDYLILKYSPDGDTLLLKTIDGEASAGDEAQAIAFDNMHNIYVTGKSLSLLNNYDYLTVKMNQAGQIIWSKKYNGIYDDYARLLCIDQIGNVYVSGESDLTANTGIVTIKYSQMTNLGPTSNLANIDYYLSNYPNPFNPKTIISYKLSMTNHIKIKIYNMLGKRIETLIDKKENAGSYQIEFDGTNLSNGIYFYSLIVEENIIKTNRMVLLK